MKFLIDFISPLLFRYCKLRIINANKTSFWSDGVGKYNIYKTEGLCCLNALISGTKYKSVSKIIVYMISYV